MPTHCEYIIQWAKDLILKQLLVRETLFILKQLLVLLTVWLLLYAHCSYCGPSELLM
uniref:Uncharacterized protein n=1 Tax=Arundo donax TaxID=35708 RepID=A0A0A8Y4W1_ARUDO